MVISNNHTKYIFDLNDNTILTANNNNYLLTVNTSATLFHRDKLEMFYFSSEESEIQALPRLIPNLINAKHESIKST